jgi:hypothetical protein
MNFTQPFPQLLAALASHRSATPEGYMHDYIAPFTIAERSLAPGRLVPTLAVPHYGNGNILQFLRKSPFASPLVLVNACLHKPALCHIDLASSDNSGC